MRFCLILTHTSYILSQIAVYVRNSTMVKRIEQRIQGDAYAIITRQLLGISILFTFVLVLFGQFAAISFMIGGLAYGLPDLFLVWRFIRYKGVSAVNEFMARFFTGKMVKLIMRSILIVTAIVHLRVNALWVITGFICCPFAFWAACMMHFSRLRGAV